MAILLINTIFDAVSAAAAIQAAVEACMHYTRLRVLCPSVVFFSLFMLSVEFVRSWAMFLYLSVF